MSVQDLGANDVQAHLQEANLAWNKISQETSWFAPELVSLPKATVEKWIDATPALSDYAFMLREAFRKQEHVLNADQEHLLSLAGPLASDPPDAYQMLSTADADFPKITLADGTEMQITYGNYMSVLMTDWNQQDRHDATEGYYSVFDNYANTFASIYNGIVQRDWFYAQARHYNSSLAAALDDDAIPVDVYTTLLDIAKKGSGPLERYQEIRQKVLGLDSYHYYDAYLPLVNVQENYSYDDAQKMVVKAVAPLGKDYQKQLEKAFSEGWIDVYENEGKESGAFSQGIYDVHPYIKLNYSDTMEDVFTLAHELGHAMHSVLADSKQPYATSNYATFIAEVASTMNEALLLDEMLKETKDPKVRVALLQERIDAISGTFYRQALFADYELKAHQLAEQGKPVTAQVLQNLFLESMKDIFGSSLDDQEMYRNTWAYVPHFFVQPPFYVFQYSTSLAASTKLHEAMTTGSKKDRAAARDRYIELLSSGGKDHPVTLLKEAGVDMTDGATYQAIVDEMNERVNQLQAELVKLGKLPKE